jgi:hypothetical protein
MTDEGARLKDLVERLLCPSKDVNELTEKEIHETMEEPDEFRVNLDRMVAGGMTPLAGSPLLPQSH